MDDAFRTEMAAGYAFDEPVVVLGSPILGDEVAVRRPRPGRRCRASTATG